MFFIQLFIPPSLTHLHKEDEENSNYILKEKQQTFIHTLTFKIGNHDSLSLSPL